MKKDEKLQFLISKDESLNLLHMVNQVVKHDIPYKYINFLGNSFDNDFCLKKYKNRLARKHIFKSIILLKLNNGDLLGIFNDAG